MPVVAHAAATAAVQDHHAAWLDPIADRLDEGYGADAADLVPRLGAADLFRAGVPVALGGTGGDVTDAIAAIAAVSARSLTAGFVFWGQRTFIEYLLQTPNTALRERLLPDLLAGRLAGATGLSNAMKFLSGLEELQVVAARDSGGFRLQGRLPWVTNLRPGNFQVAAAVAHADLPGAFVAALPHDAPGLTRSPDLGLMAMRGSATAALRIDDVRIGPEHVLHWEAARWLPQVRPAFLGLQCAMSIGLARRTLDEAKAQAGAARHVLRDSIADLEGHLAARESALADGVRRGVFQATAAALFEIRIALADIAAEAAGLELQASGGRAYLSPQGDDFARRWREVAFLPLVTPSLVQLKAALAAHQQAQAA
ncbi:MAG TPA: acyl-CoA dehydrogenase family protein [Acetobacteraceae bacterium]|nr:acyl-CoA dehydrogenase family protein [Acetobacteraceae bacterium]